MHTVSLFVTKTIRLEQSHMITAGCELHPQHDGQGCQQNICNPSTPVILVKQEAQQWDLSALVMAININSLVCVSTSGNSLCSGYVSASGSHLSARRYQDHTSENDCYNRLARKCIISLPAFFQAASFSPLPRIWLPDGILLSHCSAQIQSAR
jgi:hypothetical protein